MNTKVSRRNVFETLLFSLKMKIATENDISLYLQQSKKKTFNLYFSKVDEFFKKNYSKGLRDYLITVIKNDAEIINELDVKFLGKLKPDELLQTINEYYSFKNTNKLTENIIITNLNCLLAEKGNFGKIPKELKFYIYIFLIIQRESLEIKDAIKKRAKILLQILFINHVNENIFELASKLNKIYNTDILNAFKSNNVFNDQEYYFYYNIFEFTLCPLIKGNVIKQFDKLKNILNTKEKYVSKIIPIVLNYFDGLNYCGDSSEQSIYNDLFLFLKSKIKHRKDLYLLLKWLFINIQKGNVGLEQLQVCFSENCAGVFDYFLGEESFILDIFPKLIIRLVSTTDLQVLLIKFYSSFKEEMNHILFCQNMSFEPKFAIDYFKLIYEKINIECVSKVQLIQEIHNFNYPMDSFCVFILMNSYLYGKLASSSKFHQIVQDFENNKTIYFSNYSNIFSRITNLQQINKELQVNAINYTVLDFNDFDSLKNQLQMVLKNKSYYIYFFNMKGNLFIKKSFDEKFPQIKEIRHQSKEILYSFRGIKISDSEGYRNIFLYNKTNEMWYSIRDHRWINAIQFPKDYFSITLVYFRRNFYDDKILFDYQNKTYKHSITEREIYFKVFLDILRINPRLLIKDICFYIEWLSLNDTKHLEIIYNSIEIDEFLTNYFSINQIIKSIINSITIPQNKILKKLISDIQEKYSIITPQNFLQKLKKYIHSKKLPEDCYNDLFVRNINYYVNKIHTNKNISIIFAYYITSIVLFSKLDSDNSINFWKNNFNFDFINFPIKNDKLIILLKNNKEFLNDIQFDNIITYWNNVTLMKNMDYILKFVSELMICHQQTKQEFIQKFEILLNKNKILFAIRNNNDKNIKLVFKDFFKYLQQYCSDKGLLFEFMKISFKTTNNFLQPTDFQKEIMETYTNDYLKTTNLELFLEETKKIIKFITREEQLQTWFIKILITMQKRKTHYPLFEEFLTKLFSYIKNSSCQKLSSAIAYYLLRSHIEKEKSHIENSKLIVPIPENQTMNIHLLFLLLHPKTGQILENNQMLKQSSEFKLLANQYQILLTGKGIIKFPEEMKDNSKSIQSELEHFNKILGRCCCVLENQNYIQKDSLLNNIKYYIIYKEYEVNSNIQIQDIFTINDTVFELKGILIFDNNNKNHIFVRNGKQYWYSVTKYAWKNSINSILKKMNFSSIQKIFAIYYCIEPEDQFHSLFEDNNFNSNITSINEFYDMYEIKEEMSWFLNNAVLSFKNYFTFMYLFFDLKEEKHKQILFSFKNIPWEEEPFKNIVDLIIHKNDKKINFN